MGARRATAHPPRRREQSAKSRRDRAHGSVLRAAAPSSCRITRPQALPSDAAYRIAEGGLDLLRLYRAARFAGALRLLRGSYHIIGTALGQGKAIDELGKSDRPLAIVLGNEEHGLPPATLKACETLVTIPGLGAVQSLNVAASAAIFIPATLAGRVSISRQPAGTKDEG